MKLLGSTGSKITEKANGENASYLDINEVILIYSYRQNSRVLYKLVPNKSFG